MDEEITHKIITLYISSPLSLLESCECEECYFFGSSCILFAFCRSTIFWHLYIPVSLNNRVHSSKHCSFFIFLSISPFFSARSPNSCFLISYQRGGVRYSSRMKLLDMKYGQYFPVDSDYLVQMRISRTSCLMSVPSWAHWLPPTTTAMPLYQQTSPGRSSQESCRGNRR